jgi:pimeloyl-ACP methyl ester carboxylesterase
VLTDPLQDHSSSLQTATSVTATPLWFGDSDRPLFGWFECRSDTTAAAGVVICPPLTVEYASSQPTLRLLSTRLADQGFAVLRFDYAGTGDSAGDETEPDRVGTWLTSIRSAVECLGNAGCARVAVVGLRLGATLACAALSEGGGVDAAVLWDPYLTGRAFVRQQRLLAEVGGQQGRLADGSVEGPGIVMSPATVADLEKLQLRIDGSVADRLLVLTRSGRTLPARVSESLEDDRVTWEQIEGQESLVDIELALAVIPERTVETIVSWLSGLADGPKVPLRVAHPASAIVARDPKGQVIRERAVLLGPHHLFGIETVADDVGSKPTILFLNPGVNDHVGPARVWVVLARALAANGFRTVRFDFSGLGASAFRAGADTRTSFTLTAIQDMADAQRAISPDDPAQVVLVGLCSGCDHGSEAALSTGARGVVMINPSFRSVRMESDSGGGGGDIQAERQGDQGSRAWVKRIPGRAALWELVRRAPDPVWTLINRFVIENPPAGTARQMRDAGTDLFVVSDEYEAWVLQRGARRELARAATKEGVREGREARIRIEVIPGMDHSLFFHEGRDKALSLVVEHLTSTF